jgi:hypothetical protein
MNDETKDELVKTGASWFSRLMDRRASKGGKLVLWWRRTFGRITPEQLENIVDEADTVRRKLKR